MIYIKVKTFWQYLEAIQTANPLNPADTEAPTYNVRQMYRIDLDQVASILEGKLAFRGQPKQHFADKVIKLMQDYKGRNGLVAATKDNNDVVHGAIIYERVPDGFHVVVLAGLNDKAVYDLLANLLNKIGIKQRQALRIRFDLEYGKQIKPVLQRFKNELGEPLFGIRSEDNELIAEYPRTNVPPTSPKPTAPKPTAPEPRQPWETDPEAWKS